MDHELPRFDHRLTRAYPYGTYAARVFQGAPVEPEPLPDAVLAKPGPTLEEVREQLEDDRDSERRAERVDQRRRLVDEVKDALADEATAIVEHDDMDLEQKGTVVRAANLHDDESEPAAARAGVEVRHRFSPRPKRRSSAARIVTLRDRRRGRPRREDGEHDSDPPG